MLVDLHFTGDDQRSQLEVQIIPAVQKEYRTTAVNGDEARRIYDFLEKISMDIKIDDFGIVSEYEDTIKP